MFRVSWSIVLVSVVVATLYFSASAQAADVPPAAARFGSSHGPVLTANTTPSQQALAPESESATVGADALSYVPALAVTVATVSFSTSLQTMAFIYGLAAIIAFLVALLIKLMAMTLHRL